MKVNCENCKKPITSQVNALFEQFEPGSVVCPHCHHQQKRYVSEADLLIYFCFSAVLYSAVLVLIFFLLNWKMQAWVLILAVILFVITYIAMKYGSAQLYEKAYFKYNEKYEKYRLNIGDILLTMTGAYLGRSGIVDDENCFLNQRVLKVSSVSNAFTYCFLQKNKDNIFNLGKGSAQQNLGLKELACFDVNYSTETIKEFTNYDLFIDNIVKYKITIRKLNNIKQIYLKKFFG